MHYVLTKIFRGLENGILSLRPILFIIRTPKYDLATFCGQIHKLITFSDYTLQVSFPFSQEIGKFDPNLMMDTFDAESFFTDISLKETIGVCAKNLYGNQTQLVVYQNVLLVSRT